MATDGRPQRTKSDSDVDRQHQREMFEACDTGDLTRLQQLLEAADVKKGDAPVEPTWKSYPSEVASVPSSGPAATSSLLAHAVTHKRPNVLAYLLDTYPTASIKIDAILGAACANPDLTTFELLYARDPSIVNHEFEEVTYGETLLMQALRSDDPLFPDFLLDHGADPNESGLGAFQTPLRTAFESDQPLWLIEKMVTKSGARVHSLFVTAAIDAKRADVARFFLDRCYIDDENGLEKDDGLSGKVRELDDPELTKALERRLRKEVTNSSLIQGNREKGQAKQKSWMQRLLRR